MGLEAQTLGEGLVEDLMETDKYTPENDPMDPG